MAAEGPKSGARKRGRGAMGLAPELERSLAAYTGAALAAGVSLAAMAAPAEAKIVYTPTHTIIGSGQAVPIDLNHDGIVDFAIAHTLHYRGPNLNMTCPASNGSQCTGTNPSNEVWGQGGFASILRPGFKVRPNKSHFQQARSNFASMVAFYVGRYGSTSQIFGQWLNAKNRYLGLRFMINGEVHYGWARLSVPAQGFQTSPVLTGYAYETVPNKPIITGKIKGPDVITLDPATLGHLAGGASHIPAWHGTRNRAEAFEDSRQQTGQGSQAVP
jgi:hypothetical protein